MKPFQTLPPAALHERWANQVLMMLAFLIPCVIALILMRSSLPDFRPLFLPVLLSLLAIIALFNALQSYFAILHHRRCQWLLDAENLRFHKGLWFRHEYYIARAKVQYVDVKQGPLERHFGVSQLLIYAAGSMNLIIIKGLLYEDAQALRRELIDEKNLHDERH